MASAVQEQWDFFSDGFKCFSLLFPPYRKCRLLLQDCSLIYSILRSRIKGRWSQIAVNSLKQVQRIVPSFQITDMLFSALTYHALSLYHQGQQAMRPERGGRKEKKQREYHRLYKTVVLQSNNLSHKIRNMFTHHPKIKS